MSLPPPTAPKDAEGSSFWAVLDRGIYNVERFIVVASLFLMTLLVFLAVMWRVFAAPEGKVEGWLRALSGSEAPWVATASEALVVLLWAWLCIFAVHTARPLYSWLRCTAIGVGVAVGTILLAYGFVYLLPEGLIFSQRVALSLMMWVVLLGASMATFERRHIFLQAAQKAVPDRLLPYHAAIGNGVAAVFSFFVAYVGARYAWSNFRTWIDSDMLAGTFESIAIPNWTVAVAIPLAFGLMAMRFVAQAFAVWRGSITPVPISEGDAVDPHTFAMEENNKP